MNNVLLLGGTGFIGRHVCEKLHRQGWRITVPTRRMRNAAAVQHLPRVTVIARRSKEAYILFGADFSWVVLAIEVPGLLLAALRLRRVHVAGALVRRLWPLARYLGAATAAMHLIYVAWYLWNSSYWLPWPELFLASCALIGDSRESARET